VRQSIVKQKQVSYKIISAITPLLATRTRMRLNLSLLALAATVCCDHDVIADNTTVISSIRTPDLVLETSDGSPIVNSTSGSVVIRSGRSYNETSVGGNVTILAGESTKGRGGNVDMAGGASSGHSDGGDITFKGGDAVRGRGGNVEVQSGSSSKGVSGHIALSSAATSVEGGNSGSLNLFTGEAKGGSGGAIVVQSGNGGYYDGGDITLVAGQTSGNGFKGGSVHLNGGEGSSSHSTDGGDGGDLVLTGGEAKGEGEGDDGGSIALQGGISFAGHGGSLRLSSGVSSETSSGDVCKCNSVSLFVLSFSTRTIDFPFDKCSTPHSDCQCKVWSRRVEWDCYFEHGSIQQWPRNEWIDQFEYWKRLWWGDGWNIDRGWNSHRHG